MHCVGDAVNNSISTCFVFESCLLSSITKYILSFLLFTIIQELCYEWWFYALCTAVFVIHSCVRYSQLCSLYTAVFVIHNCVRYTQLCSLYTAVFVIHSCVRYTQLCSLFCVHFSLFTWIKLLRCTYVGQFVVNPLRSICRINISIYEVHLTILRHV